MNTLELNKLFPKAPAYRANWWPIQMETILGSGERLTIAICVLSQNKGHLVMPTLRKELIKCLYGSNGDKFESKIKFVIDSLEAHLSFSNKNTPDNWDSPFESIHVGDKRVGAAHDSNGIFNQAIQLTSSFSQLITEEEEKAKEKRYFDSWINRVILSAVSKSPDLNGYFKQKINVGSTRKKTSFSFVNEKYAFNHFNLNIEDSNIEKNYKSKIFDLEQLFKSGYQFKPDQLEGYELIALNPKEKSLELPRKLFEKNQELVKDLSFYTSSRGIGFFNAENEDDLVNRLLEKAS